MDTRDASGSITLGPFTIAPVTLPEALFGSAVMQMQGIRIVANAGSAAIPMLVLSAGFVLELLLKAHLAKQGKTEKELSRTPYGHDLKFLWMEADRVGLSIGSTLPDWVAILDGLHSTYTLRYPVGLHMIAFPPVDATVSGLESLLKMVAQHIR